jgi:hypothetical protein
MVVPTSQEALGLPSPAGNSQPGAWLQVGEDRSQGLARTRGICMQVQTPT